MTREEKNRRNREYYQLAKDSINARRRARRKLEPAKPSTPAGRQRNAAKARKWRKKHQEHFRKYMREYMRVYAARHRSTHPRPGRPPTLTPAQRQANNAASQKRYYAKNRQKCLAASRNWAKDHAAYFRQYQQNYRKSKLQPQA
jgi:hypothetical protein